MMTAGNIIAFVQSRVRARQYRLSSHAEREREADQISMREIEEALLSARLDVIEDYANDPRGASCLLVGFTRKSKPIHLVCGISLPDVIVVITIYRPNPAEWINWRRRKEQSE